MLSFRWVPVILILGLVLGMAAACGGDDESDTVDDEPTAAATSGGEDSEPTARASATPEEEDEPEGEVPTFEDGEWTGGEATVNVSGSDTRTVTGTLISESSTDGGTTRLIYTNDLDTINFSISIEYQPFDMSVSQSGFRARLPIDGEPCTVTYAEASETRIEATFRCDAQNESPTRDPLVLEGSFTATR